MRATRPLLVILACLLVPLVLGACSKAAPASSASSRSAASPVAETGGGAGASPGQTGGSAAEGAPATATTAQTGAPAAPDLSAFHVLVIVAPEAFRDEEFQATYDALGAGDAKMTVGSLRKGEVSGVGGTKVQSVITPAQVKAADYDAVVFIGGPGMVKYVKDPAFVDLAKRFAEKKRFTFAICVAPAILANAGLLKGVEATAWPSMKPVLAAGGAKVSEEHVVVAGKIITADGPAAAKDFAKAVVAKLSKAKPIAAGGR